MIFFVSARHARKAFAVSSQRPAKCRRRDQSMQARMGLRDMPANRVQLGFDGM